MADLIKENTFAKFMKGSLVFIGFSEVCTPVTKITKTYIFHFILHAKQLTNLLLVANIRNRQQCSFF